jgi:protein-S-isoprenylcysteine O-methyltransferase Ste14
MRIPSAPQLVLLLFLGGLFVHFMAAGGRTFAFSKDAGDELGPNLLLLDFIMGGTLTAWILGLFYLPIAMANGVVAAALLVISAALYEWARHTIWRRRFGIAFADQVPEAVCVEGPYRWVRHPLYVSYLVAYLAVLVALPHWLTAAVFAVNIALFVFAARSDERNLAASALAADYAAYRERTGMFVPRFSRPAPGR